MWAAHKLYINIRNNQANRSSKKGCFWTEKANPCLVLDDFATRTRLWKTRRSAAGISRELKQSIHFVLITLTSNNQRYSALWRFSWFAAKLYLQQLQPPVAFYLIHLRTVYAFASNFGLLIYPDSLATFSKRVERMIHVHTCTRACMARRERAGIDWSCMSAERERHTTEEEFNSFRNFLCPARRGDPRVRARTLDLRFRYPVTSANICLWTLAAAVSALCSPHF